MKCELSVSKHLKHTFTLKTSKVRNFRCMCWVSVLHSCSSNEQNYNNKIFCCKVDLFFSELVRKTHEGRGKERPWRKEKRKQRKASSDAARGRVDLSGQPAARPATQEPQFETHIHRLLQLMSILSVLNNGEGSTTVWGTFTETWFDGDRVRRVLLFCEKEIKESKQNISWPPEKQVDCLKKLCRNIKDKGWRSTSGKKPSRILTPPARLPRRLLVLPLCLSVRLCTESHDLCPH